MKGIVFEHPWAFVIIALYLICALFCKPKSESFYFPGAKILQKVSQKSSIIANLLKFLIVASFATALASPVVENKLNIQNNKGYEISLIMDASGSMREYNKFGIVKNIVSDFLDRRKSDKIGLTIFADFAYVAVPLTYDKKSIKRLLKRIDVGVAGVRRTALYEALFLSSNLFKNSHSKNKIAILLTDGVDNANTIPLDVAIKTVKKYGIKVYTIGVGRAGDFNPKVLKYIADQSGGKFFQADSIDRLKEVYKTIDKLEKSEIKSRKYIKKDYYFQYPLALGLLLLLVLFVYRNLGGAK